MHVLQEAAASAKAENKDSDELQIVSFIANVLNAVAMSWVSDAQHDLIGSARKASNTSSGGAKYASP
eukprot:3861231-Amphidinium_carterae.1